MSRWVLPQHDLTASSFQHDTERRERYERFCYDHQVSTLDVSAMLRFLESRSEQVGPNSLRSEVAAIRRLFLDRGLDDPLRAHIAARVDRLYERTRARPIPLYQSHSYHALIDSLPRSPLGLRDAAMLGLIYSARLSALELAAFDPPHAVFSHEGVRLERVQLPGKPILSLRRIRDERYCPVSLLERWCAHIEYRAPGFRIFGKSRMKDGRLSCHGIVSAITRRLRDAHLGGGLVSLKATMIVVAADRGATNYDIMAQTACRTTLTIDKWKRRGGVISSFPTSRLGL